MTRVSNWSLAIGLFGLVFALGSGLRYFVLWIDYDKGISYGILGITIIALAWVYNELLKLRVETDALSEALHEHINNER